MQSRYYTAPRSPLSSTTTMSQMEANLRGIPATPAPAAPRYTDEQHLALRAWSSAKLRTAPLTEQVETLRHYPGLEPVYGNYARVALQTRTERDLQEAADKLWQATTRKHDSRLLVRRALGNWAPLVLA